MATSYHLKLLQDLRGVVNKLQQQDHNYDDMADLDQSTQMVAQDMFEDGFVMSLVFNTLDPADIDMLPVSTSRDLLCKTKKLICLLNDAVNDHFEALQSDSYETQIPRIRGPLVESTRCRKLERLLVAIDSCPGPFEISSGGPKSLFSFQSTQDIHAARLAVRNLNYVHNKIRASEMPSATFPQKSSSHAEAPEYARTQIKAFDDLFLEPLSRLLDETRRKFSECSQHASSAGHHIFLRLEDTELYNTPSLEQGTSLYLSCPLSTAALFTVCHYQSVSHKLNRKRLCQMMKSATSHGEVLNLSFDPKTDTLASTAKETVDCDAGKAFHQICLDDLIYQHQAFSPPFGGKEQDFVFDHNQKRRLAVLLAVNFLVFFWSRHTPDLWSGTDIHFFVSSANACVESNPYIQCKQPPVVSEELTLILDDEDGEPISCFTNLARLLLQLEYGPIPNEIPAKDLHSDLEHDYAHVKRFYTAKLGYFDLSRKSYLEAIDACLHFRRKYDLERAQVSATSETPKETCKRIIFQNVIKRLMHEAEIPLATRKRGRNSDIPPDDNDFSSPQHRWNSHEPTKRPKPDELRPYSLQASQSKRNAQQFSAELLSVIEEDQKKSENISESRKGTSNRLISQRQMTRDDRAPVGSMKINRDYTVGWLCALSIELAAAVIMLDEEPVVESIGEDSNTYYLGHVAGRGVVIVCLPAGTIGNTSAATVAAQMKLSFPSLSHFILVGIGGGVPTDENRIRLGDVVIGKPTGSHPGVVQYDLGKFDPDGGTSRTGSLCRPSNKLLQALNQVDLQFILGTSKAMQHLAKFSTIERFSCPERGTDPRYKGKTVSILAPTTISGNITGSEMSCDVLKLGYHKPRLFLGTIGSGNRVIKNASVRDKISNELGGVLCFEMEAAGVLASFPCLVIRGICDYADESKEKRWQPYAAAVAASYAKEIICAITF